MVAGESRITKAVRRTGGITATPSIQSAFTLEASCHSRKNQI
jgi:hypothetical protein